VARSRSLELVKLTDVVLVLYVGRYPEKARRQVLDKPRLRDGGNDEFRSKTLASLELHSQHCLHLNQQRGLDGLMMRTFLRAALFRKETGGWEIVI
jgi:hypothetical protein